MIGGLGSHWSVGDDLVVGRNGQGSLLIAGGGSVEVMGDATIGMNQTSAGSVTVRGSSSRWTIDGRLLVRDFGDFGYGRLTIEDGGEVVASGGDHSFFGSTMTVARGNVHVSGRNSRLQAEQGVSLSEFGSVDV
jgi:T5SS/PEP-CTERM-associated repeat protein